jgi:hypothetical protein
MSSIPPLGIGAARPPRPPFNTNVVATAAPAGRPTGVQPSDGTSGATGARAISAVSVRPRCASGPAIRRAAAALEAIIMACQQRGVRLGAREKVLLDRAVAKIRGAERP